jgi:hypothetical protein
MAPPAAQKREDRGRPLATQGKRGAQIRTSERHAQSEGGVDLIPNGREACAVQQWRRACTSNESTSPAAPGGPRRELERWGAEGQPAGSGLAPGGWDGGRLPGTTARKRVATDG